MADASLLGAGLRPFLDPRVTARTFLELAGRRSVALGCLAVFVLAYLAELGSPTYSTDFLFDADLVGQPYRPYYVDGRYLPAVLRQLSGDVFPPTLLLLLGLAFFFCAGVLTAIMFGISSAPAVVIICGLYATFPFLIETFSFHPIRHMVPLSVLIAIWSLAHGGLTRSVWPSVIGVVPIVVVLSLYQSAILVPIMLICMLSALRLAQGEPLRALVLGFVLPRVAALLLAGLIYALSIRLLEPLMPYPMNRMGAVALTLDPGQLQLTWTLVVGAMWEIVGKDVFLFPAFPKWLFGAIYLGVIGLVLARSRERPWLARLVAVALVLILPWLSFGATWFSGRPVPLLLDRILFPVEAWYVAGFAAAFTLSRRGRLPVLVAGGAIVATFIVQTNLANVYLDLKNRADFDMASKVAERVVAHPDYRPGLPLAMIGSTSAAQYLPFRVFDTGRDIITSRALNSSFSREAIAYRPLLFFFPSRVPTSEELARARELSAALPPWPDARAVAIEQGMIIVVLSH